MKPLNFPTFNYKISHSEAGEYIYDIIRKKYVRLTPEEWVRQHCLHYLVNYLSYPQALIRLEQRIQYVHLQHRPDIVVYDRSAKPLLLVECKSPSTHLNAEVWNQIARYNFHFNAPMISITNGIQHFCWQIDYEKGEHKLLPAIPPYHSPLPPASAGGHKSLFPKRDCAAARAANKIF